MSSIIKKQLYHNGIRINIQTIRNVMPQQRETNRFDLQSHILVLSSLPCLRERKPATKWSSAVRTL